MARTGRPKIDYVKVRLLYDQGLSDPEIADLVPCGVKTVWDWRKREGLPGHKRKNQTIREANEFVVPEQYICYTQPRINLSFDMTVAKLCIQRWNEGADIEAIAEDLCRSVDEVFCLIHSLAIDGKIKWRGPNGIYGVQ